MGPPLSGRGHQGLGRALHLGPHEAGEFSGDRRHDLLGRQALVSPREFETIDGWRRRGIPLTVVLEVIADAGKRRSGRGPQALTALSHAVSDAWAVVCAGRIARNVADAPGRTSCRAGDERRIGGVATVR